MDQRGPTPEVDWPARPDLSLALNRMGTFDWDLDSERMHLDATALEVLELRPEEFDGTPAGLLRRVLPGERARLERRVERALTDGRSHYGGTSAASAGTAAPPGPMSRGASCGTRTAARTGSSGSSATPPRTPASRARPGSGTRGAAG